MWFTMSVRICAGICPCMKITPSEFTRLVLSVVALPVADAVIPSALVALRSTVKSADPVVDQVVRQRQSQHRRRRILLPELRRIGGRPRDHIVRRKEVEHAARRIRLLAQRRTCSCPPCCKKHSQSHHSPPSHRCSRSPARASHSSCTASAPADARHRSSGSCRPHAHPRPVRIAESRPACSRVSPCHHWQTPPPRATHTPGSDCSSPDAGSVACTQTVPHSDG